MSIIVKGEDILLKNVKRGCKMRNKLHNTTCSLHLKKGKNRFNDELDMDNDKSAEVNY